MVEFWTEDSGAGYDLLYNLLTFYYGDNIIVKPHNGNGGRYTKHKKTKQGTGEELLSINKDLHKKSEGVSTIFILFDCAFDNAEIIKARAMLKDIIKDKINYNNKFLVLVYDWYCFERVLLSYTKLLRYGACSVDDKEMEFDLMVFFNSFDTNYNFDIEKFNSSANFKTLDFISGEKLAKRLLTRATNKANIHLYAKSINGAIITGKQLGCCWRYDCCRYRSGAYMLLCDNCIRLSLAEKYRDLIENSELIQLFTFINLRLMECITSFYNTFSDETIYQKKLNSLSEQRKAQHCIHILNYAHLHKGKWNYEKVYGSVDFLD